MDQPNATVDQITQIVMRRLLFHLVALQGGQVTLSPTEFDAGLGMSVAVRVHEGHFVFTLITNERVKELGPVTEV